MTADRRAAALSVKLLLRLKAVHLPLDPLQMVRRIPRVGAVSYVEYAVHTGQSPEVHCAVSDYGYTARRADGRSKILYNARQSPESIRFTLAHELGHMMLRHPSDEPALDRQADCFARCLLCPVPYADELGLRLPEEYQMLFSVPREVAEAAVRHRREDRALLRPELYRAARNQFRAALGRPPLGEGRVPVFSRSPATTQQEE